MLGSNHPSLSAPLTLISDSHSHSLVPNPPRPGRRPPCKLKVGKWADKKEDGSEEEKDVLIKSINMLHEREVSSWRVSVTDSNSQCMASLPSPSLLPNS